MKASTWIEGDTLVVALDLKQMIAVIHNAPNPSDKSKEALLGRKLLKTIDYMHRKHCEEHGQCSIKLVRRCRNGRLV